MDASPDGFASVEARLERIACGQARIVNFARNTGYPRVLPGRRIYWSFQLLRFEGSREQNSCKVTGLY